MVHATRPIGWQAAVLISTFALIVIGTSQVHAARLFFSRTGPGTPLGITSAEDSLPRVPRVEGFGDAELHIWLRPTEVVDGVSSRERYTSISYSVAAASYAFAAASSVSNPINSIAEQLRWSVTNSGELNVEGAERLLVRDARAAALMAFDPGIGSLQLHSGDMERDPGSGAFHIGSLRIRGSAAGVVGLYLRTGSGGMRVTNQSGQVIDPVLAFGDSPPSPELFASSRDTGDAITADLAEADAFIITCGAPEPPPIARYLHDGTACGTGDPNWITVPGPTGARLLELPLGGTPTVGVVFEQWTRQVFEIFVDMSVPGSDGIPDYQWTYLGLAAQSVGAELTDVRDTFPLGGAINYDFRLRFAATPGNDQTIMFDLDYLVPGGTNLDYIGVVPEPSGFGLIALALAAVAIARSCPTIEMVGYFRASWVGRGQGNGASQ